MASKKARKRQTRRDRRKAKQSGWRRGGKVRWDKAGHGSGSAFPGGGPRGRGPGPR